MNPGGLKCQLHTHTHTHMHTHSHTYTLTHTTTHTYTLTHTTTHTYTHSYTHTHTHTHTHKDKLYTHQDDSEKRDANNIKLQHKYGLYIYFLQLGFIII
jgi:hypothetical protein